MKTIYTVIVGNIGNVYSGECLKTAESTYAEYVSQSTANYGRAAGESVALFGAGELIKEYSPSPVLKSASLSASNL